MISRTKRLILLMLLAGGVIYQSNAGLARCIGDESLNTVNFCFIFDCQNGALGGLIDFCPDGAPVFIDCP